VAYVISTSEGLMMIDSLRPNFIETQLLPGFQKLGLDPAKVKMIFITHGHADHFGGAAYFQEHYGSHVYISQGDWDFMEHPPARRAGAAPAPVIPKHDMVITEGQPIVLGDEKLVAYPAGPHTPGSMGFIFPVKDNGKTHMAALFGSILLLTSGTTDEGMQTHLKVIEHFKEQAKEAKVDVELQNHPLFDNFTVKLAKLQNRKTGEPNPFIVGEANYGKFMDVMSACMQAEIDRRANK
jgi:metallo-beta-lactamase class B